jgi:hypothetical protein
MGFLSDSKGLEFPRDPIIAEHSYLAAGGSVELHKFGGRPHSFITNEPDAETTKDAIEKLRNFVLAQA